jgi:hypothetical protein
MRRLVKLLVITVIAAAAGPVAAHAGTPGISPPSSESVFPQPRDPWKSWGVRSDVPRRVGRPRADGGVAATTQAPSVWVPGQWVWDGATGAWLWWPGHWVR